MGWSYLSTADSRPSEIAPKSVGPSPLRLGLEFLRQDEGTETVSITGTGSFPPLLQSRVYFDRIRIVSDWIRHDPM